MRSSYIEFLKRNLRYHEKVLKNKGLVNVSNNELLKILNTNPLESQKTKQLAKIAQIGRTGTKSDTGSLDAKTSTTPVYNTNKNLVELILPTYNNDNVRRNTYIKPKKPPLFVKFNTSLTLDGFSINKNNIYVVHNINYHSNPTKPPTKIYLEEYLLEPVVSNTIIKVKPPTQTINLLNTIDLHDCTETFRKELVGVSNIIEVKDKNRFTVAFDNVPLEFKNYYQDTITIKEDDSIRKSCKK